MADIDALLKRAGVTGGTAPSTSGRSSNTLSMQRLQKLRNFRTPTPTRRSGSQVITAPSERARREHVEKMRELAVEREQNIQDHEAHLRRLEIEKQRALVKAAQEQGPGLATLVDLCELLVVDEDAA